MKMIEKKEKKWLHTVAVDAVLFTVEEGKLKVLLIKRDKEPFTGSYSLPGVILREDENLSEAVGRALKSKAGVSSIYLEQLYTFDGTDRDPRGNIISVTYFALVSKDKIEIGSNENNEGEVILIDINKLPKLAFDHNDIIAYASKRLRFKLEYTNAAYSLLPELFSLAELKETYEAILNRKLDKRNFLKKYLSLDMLEATSKMLRGGRQRPAKLYRFKKTELQELKRFF